MSHDGGAQSEGPEDQAAEDIQGDVWRASDWALKKGLSGWWARQDEGQRTAWALLAFAAAIGPLGQSGLAGFQRLYTGQIPTAQQLSAAIWLFLITAPIIALVMVLFVFLNGPNWRIVVPGALLAAAIAGGIYVPAVAPLEDLYCYNDGTILERECRDFNQLGLQRDIAANMSPARYGEAAKAVFVHTIDARGGVMAFAALVGAGAVGYLIRRHDY